MDKLEPLENERWVWAKTFKREYPNHLVSDMGRCYNSKTKRFVGHWHNGYWTVSLYDKDKPERMMIGRLMLISFGVEIPNHLKELPTSKLQAMHLDGNSHNNSLGNFAWGDANENRNEKNCQKRQSESHIGKRQNCKKVLQYSKDGTLIREWDSTMDVERELGVLATNIGRCCRKEKYYKTAGGYIWKYKEEAV